ncbi:20275_t:CDS:2, partial [Racocetra persica]
KQNNVKNGRSIRKRRRQLDSRIINLNDINRIAGWVDYRQKKVFVSEGDNSTLELLISMILIELQDGLVNSPIESIYWSDKKSPYFGSDLCMTSSSTWNSIKRSYEHEIISEGTFFAEDYE